VEIDNAFEVPVPIGEAWAILTDIEGIAPCMPGAELTEVVDGTSYKGKISVRLGPVALVFNGTARFEEIDEAGYRARVKASGRDSKGRGGADAMVVFHLEPDGNGTKVLIHTDLQLSGSVAQYGRGASMISALAGQLIGQFADCLKATLAERDGPEAASPKPAPAKPISAFDLGFRVLWDAIRGAVRRLFGRI
jgi:hypothetical protein